MRDAPVVSEMIVVPVAGHDSTLLNLGGAHDPFFTRNVLILKDNASQAATPPRSVMNWRRCMAPPNP